MTYIANWKSICKRGGTKGHTKQKSKKWIQNEKETKQKLMDKQMYRSKKNLKKEKAIEMEEKLVVQRKEEEEEQYY